MSVLEGKEQKLDVFYKEGATGIYIKTSGPLKCSGELSASHEN